MITTKNKSKKSTGKTSASASSKRPAKRSANKDEILYPSEAETADQREGVDVTFTERNDVTPPNRKEFPSVGAAKTDFASRPQGRTIGRMIGHEPGTEGI